MLDVKPDRLLGAERVDPFAQGVERSFEVGAMRSRQQG